MTNAAKWSIGIALVMLEVLLVVLGWNWVKTPVENTPPPTAGVASGDKAPRSVWGAETVDVAAAAQLFCDGAIFLDAQSEANFAVSAIPNAEWIDYEHGLTRRKLARHAGPADQIVVYCENAYCWSAYHATKQLIAWDMPHVYYFRDGLAAWNRERYAIQNSLRGKECKRSTWQPKAGFSAVNQ
ncbi:rhodanese-like domain-containing protein [Endothiovibrio diazotrophicus]